MKIVAFFNSKVSVGQTSLVYHLGYSYADQGKRVLMVDLDPQSNLTALCVDEERLEQLWVADDTQRKSIRSAVQPIIGELGDVPAPHFEELNERIALIPGDIRLSEFEQKLSEAWPRCLDGDLASLGMVSSFYREISMAAEQHEADLTLIDVGPNLSAINRSALIAADSLVTPLEADLFSMQGLQSLGPTLVRWREEWKERLSKNPAPSLPLPSGTMTPVGYVVMRPSLYSSQIIDAYERWLIEIPRVYHEMVLHDSNSVGLSITKDESCLAVLRHYRSLMTMAQAARKPIFKLTPADGAIGAHAKAVHEVGKEFRLLAERLLSRVSVDLSHATGDSSRSGT